MNQLAVPKTLTTDSVAPAQAFQAAVSARARSNRLMTRNPAAVEQPGLSLRFAHEDRLLGRSPSSSAPIQPGIGSSVPNMVSILEPASRVITYSTYGGYGGLLCRTPPTVRKRATITPTTPCPWVFHWPQ